MAWKIRQGKQNVAFWLDCEFVGKGTKRVVEKLKCDVCIQYKSQIESWRNYSDKWQVPIR